MDPGAIQDSIGTIQYTLQRARGGGPRPFIVFLHGSGERGTDNHAQMSYPFFEDPDSLFGPVTMRADPAHVLAPQCPEDDKWVDVPKWDVAKITLAAQPTQAMANVLILLDDLRKKPHIDTKRIYLVGLSMGAFGVYDLLARRPKVFAAAIAICGAGDVKQAATYAHVPMSIAHGLHDRSVSIERSREMARALRAAGGSPRLIEYADASHDVWNRALSEPALVAWCFQQVLR